jgi:hypothetical protein
MPICFSQGADDQFRRLLGPVGTPFGHPGEAFAKAPQISDAGGSLFGQEKAALFEDVPSQNMVRMGTAQVPEA